jgi:hypothetical protein
MLVANETPLHRSVRVPALIYTATRTRSMSCGHRRRRSCTARTTCPGCLLVVKQSQRHVETGWGRELDRFPAPWLGVGEVGVRLTLEETRWEDDVPLQWSWCLASFCPCPLCGVQQWGLANGGPQQDLGRIVSGMGCRESGRNEGLGQQLMRTSQARSRQG